MAQLPWAANTGDNKAGMEDWSPLPTDAYNAMITKSEMKETKNKDGHYLQLNMKVIDGQYKGRTIIDRLNLDNPNPVAVEIANKALNSMCQACQKVGVQDSEELHGIPMEVKVKFIPETDNQPASNNVTFYGPYKGEKTADTAGGGEQPAANAPPAFAQSQAVAKKAPPKAAPKAAPKKLPWEK